MQVLSVRVGLTKNLGNYESAKLEVEASPENGQNLEQFFSEVNDYLEKQVEIAISNAGGVKEKPAKAAKKTEAPFKADPTTEISQATGKSTTSATPSAVDEKPMTPRSLAKAGKAARAAEKANVNAPDSKKELKYTLESETLDELLDRFNTLRKLATYFGEDWEAAVTKIADRYRKLNSLDADPETLDALVKAFKSERQAIEKQKSELVTA